MSMYNPPHPGEFIKETYLDPFGISQNEMADKLNVARSTFNRLVRGDYRVSPEMSLRLSRVVGRTPESWLNMQARFDLYNEELEEDKFEGLEMFPFPDTFGSGSVEQRFQPGG